MDAPPAAQDGRIVPQGNPVMPGLRDTWLAKRTVIPGGLGHVGHDGKGVRQPISGRVFNFPWLVKRPATQDVLASCGE
jgi:hypothetical protein